MRIATIVNLWTRSNWKTGVGAALTLLLTGIWACDSANPSDDGGVKPPGQLKIVQLSTIAPQLPSTSVSFWAKFDEDTEAEIDFEISPGEFETFLELKVDKFSLLARPDGSLFGPGDSVLITISMVNQTDMLFEFQPAGLKFNPLRPAELKIEYGHGGEDDTEQDWDGDGTAGDSDDDAIEAQFAIWRQPNIGLDFIRLGSLQLEDQNEVEADVLGFSRFALAY